MNGQIFKQNYFKGALWMMSTALFFLPLSSRAQEADCSVTEPTPRFSFKALKNKPTSSRHKLSIIKKQVQSAYPAQVLAVRGDVVLLERNGKALTYAQPLLVGQSLYLNDVIETRTQSFMSLRLRDGTENALPANAQVKLLQSSPSVAKLFLIKGGVESRVKKAPNAKKNTFEIQMPTVSIGVRGTYFRVNVAPEGGRVEVENGTVRVAQRQVCTTPVIVNAGQGVRVDDQSISSPVTLLAAPTIDQPEAAQRKESAIVLHINPVEGARSYRAQIASDERFIDIQAEAQSDAPVVTFNGYDFVDGFYYVRVSAVDATGIQGKTRSYPLLRNVE